MGDSVDYLAELAELKLAVAELELHKSRLMYTWFWEELCLLTGK